ncbi:THUMP domain-containing protein 3 [Mortierella alpina]|uniref:THUMP domain-containing protein 3 n=1 Tax=Mortierella alpina TaxID=64518 RepID=A0A9P6LZJ4_MORAP|nr:THUMP domain-containing protein 3 [Mortierella alpina]
MSPQPAERWSMEPSSAHQQTVCEKAGSSRTTNVDAHSLPQTIDLILSVPAGLEDVAVRQLPARLVDVATDISYRTGSGYLEVHILRSDSSEQDPQNETVETCGESVMEVITDLVSHPPLCIFGAYVAMGDIVIPQATFQAPKDLLTYAMAGFQQPQQLNSDDENLSKTTTAVYSGGEGVDLGLRWQDALSVLESTPTPLAHRLASSRIDREDIEPRAPICFRASFDRGDVQHKGVRSQDLAAALGGLTGDVFPSWKVDLTGYDVEVFARWIQQDKELVQCKSRAAWRSTAALGPSQGGGGNIHKRPRTESDLEETTAARDGAPMQVGMTLPLALSSCPYRYRPVDGRTSLKVEITYNLLAMAAPRPGNIVLDICSGVGTIPIIGAAHYPECLFAGFEIVPHNVDKAAQNAREMIPKAEQEYKARTTDPKTVRARVSPSLFLGDARAVCWRTATADLIISDLPWGQRENSHVYNCKLYPRLIKEVIRLLKVSGRAVLVTGERKLLQRQLDAPFARPHLRLLQKREITIGFKVMIFELERI